MTVTKVGKNLFFALSCTVFLTHHAFAIADDSDAKRRVDMLERSINTMQKQLNNMQNEKALKAVEKKDKKSYSFEKMNELTQELKLLREEMTRINSDNKQLSNELRTLKTQTSEAIEDFKKDRGNTKVLNSQGYIIDNISREIESGPVEGASQNVGTKYDNSASPEILYQKAYSLLKSQDNSKNNIAAARVFEEFVQKYPNHALTGNAYYWLGQVNVEKSDYGKAAIEYLNGYKANSTSGRASYNLIGLANSLTQLGKTREVCYTLNKLYNDFPNLHGELKRSADKMYNDSGCNK